MNTSPSINKLSVAFAKAFANIGKAHKGSTNPHYRSSYASLEEVMDAVKEPLAEQGIAVLQLPSVSETGLPMLETVILHESGEFIASHMPVICAKQNDPQALGSAITYAKRYALQAALFVPSVDDDGEGAMHRKPEPQRTQQPKPQAPQEAPVESSEPTFAGPNHKKLFQTFIELGISDLEFMAAMKNENLIPQNAKSYFGMSEETATKFLKGENAKEKIEEAVTTWQAIKAL